MGKKKKSVMPPMPQDSPRPSGPLNPHPTEVVRDVLSKLKPGGPLRPRGSAT